jgi:hypothetical protein
MKSFTSFAGVAGVFLALLAGCSGGQNKPLDGEIDVLVRSAHAAG